MGAADAAVDLHILGGLHEEGHAGHGGGGGTEPADDLVGTGAALVARFEIDVEAAGIDRGIHRAGTDKGGDALDIGVLPDDFRDLPLQRHHGLVRNGLRGVGDSEDETGILFGQQALGHHHVQQEIEGGEDGGQNQGEPLVAEHPLQAAAVGMEHALEKTFGDAEKAAVLVVLLLALFAQQPGAHHGREREGHHGGDGHGHAEGDGEFPEQAADNAGHEQQRDENRDQGYAQGDDGEADLFRAFEGGLHGGFAVLDVADDVLDHDDGVIHHEAGGNGEGHQ